MTSLHTPKMRVRALQEWQQKTGCRQHHELSELTDLPACEFTPAQLATLTGLGAPLIPLEKLPDGDWLTLDCFMAPSGETEGAHDGPVILTRAGKVFSIEVHYQREHGARIPADTRPPGEIDTPNPSPAEQLEIIARTEMVFREKYPGPRPRLLRVRATA